jgi:hypothetical protein
LIKQNKKLIKMIPLSGSDPTFAVLITLIEIQGSQFCNMNTPNNLQGFQQQEKVALDCVFLLNSFITVSCNMTQQNYHIRIILHPKIHHVGKIQLLVSLP